MEKASRLKHLRLKANLSQRELSKKLGYARQTLSNWEIDFSGVSVADAIKIADFFGVSLDYLLGRVDKDERASIIKNAVKQINLDELAELIAAGKKR